MEHHTLKFNAGKKKYQFEIVHNLKDVGLCIENALINWTARTTKFKEELFCEYVKSKDSVNVICMTKEEFDRINKSI